MSDHAWAVGDEPVSCISGFRVMYAISVTGAMVRLRFLSAERCGLEIKGIRGEVRLWKLGG